MPFIIHRSQGVSAHPCCSPSPPIPLHKPGPTHHPPISLDEVAKPPQPASLRIRCFFRKSIAIHKNYPLTHHPRQAKWICPSCMQQPPLLDLTRRVSFELILGKSEWLCNNIQLGRGRDILSNMPRFIATKEVLSASPDSPSPWLRQG